jgi:hypothetical protein
MAPDAAIARAGGEAAAELAALSDPTSSAWSEPDEAGLL